MDVFLEPLLGAIVWTFANVVYVDLLRKGRGRGRLIAFLAGFPGTVVSRVVVREGTIPQIEQPPDDEDRLLREIRVDRQLRRGREPEGLGGGEREEPPAG